LQGIEQFQRLRVLSAADNLLPDISCLEILTVCPNLQVRKQQQACFRHLQAAHAASAEQDNQHP
jgi:hypothetical protein